MSGKKQKRKRARKPIRKLPVPRPSRRIDLRRFYSSFWGIIVSISVILTIVGTIFAFFTKISVQPENSLTPPDIAMATFIISNDSLLPISDISYSCKTYNIEPSVFRKELQTDKEGRIGALDKIEILPGPAYVHSTLQPGDKESFDCWTGAISVVEGPIQYADLEMIVSYRPLWILWKQERKFSFRTGKASDGKLIWIPSGNY